MATTTTIYQEDEMAVSTNITGVRLGGLTALSGAIIMIFGAILYFSSGTDLWAAVDGGDIAGYLITAGTVKSQLIANLSLWIIGVLVLGTAWHAIIPLCVQKPVQAKIATIFVSSAVPLAIVSYIMMLVLIVLIAPDTSSTSLIVAKIVGWIAIRTDDLATALLIGFPPLFVTIAARRDWMPNWLATWGYLAGVVGLFSLIVLYIPELIKFGMIIIPVGVGWMVAVGIVLLRK
jgi:hypothetical protein